MDHYTRFRVWHIGRYSDVIDLYGEEKIKAVLSKSRMLPVTGAMAYLFLDLAQKNVA
jgi:hypothetical protein